MAIRKGDGMYWKTGIDNTGLNKGAAQAKGIIRTLSQQITGMDVFAGLGIAATAVFAKITKKAKQMATELEQSMREVQTISAAAQNNFEDMTQAVIDMSTTVPDSANKLTKALYQIVSAGYDGAEGLRLLETASKAAVAGVTDTTTAADGLTTVMNAWGYESSQATEVADIMFQTVKLGKTTFDQIAGSISQVASIASASGISFEEISAAIASLTKQGVPTAQAMTQIRSAIIGVTETLGDGWSEAYTLQEAFALIEEKANGSQLEMKEMLGRIEAVNAVLGTTGKNAEMAAADLDAMNSAVGESTAAFDYMSESVKNRMDIVANIIDAKLLPIGNKLKDTFADTAVSFAKALESGKIREVADILSVLVTAMIAYKVSTAAATLTSTGFVSILAKVRGAMIALNATMLKNPMALIVAGVAAAVVAFQKYANKSKEFVDSIYDITEASENYQKQVAKVELELEGLFNVAKRAEKGTDAHKEAIKAINTQYGDYLENLLTEKSSLEDIEEAQNAAKEAAISRIAETSKAKALSTELEKLTDQYGITQQKLFETFRDEVGDQGTLSALKNFRQLIKEVDEARKSPKFEDLGNGFKTLIPEEQRVGDIINEFVDKYFYAVEDKAAAAGAILEQVFFVESAEEFYDEAEKQVSAYFDGFIKTLTKKTKETPEGTKIKLLDAEDLDKELKAVEAAFEEIRLLKENNLPVPDEVYGDILKTANTFDEYLAKMREKYEGLAVQMNIINLKIASRIEKNMKDLVDGVKKYTEIISKGTIDSVSKWVTEFTALAAKLEKELKGAREIFGVKFLASEWEEVVDQVENFGKAAYDIGNIVGRLDKNLGEVLYTIGDAVTGISKIMGGDVFGGSMDILSSVVSVITMVKKFQNEMEQQALADAVTRMDKAVASMNRKLEEHLELIDKINQAEWLSGSKILIEELNSELEETLRMLNEQAMPGGMQKEIAANWWISPFTGEYKESKRRKEVDLGFDTSDYEIEDWKSLLENKNIILTDATRDYIEGLIDRYEQAADGIDELNQQMYESVTGRAGHESLVDEIVEMFKRGEDAAEDFTQKFEDLMKDALIGTFKEQFLVKQMEEFYDEFYSALTTGTTPTYFDPKEGKFQRRDMIGGLDSDEVSDLQDMWDKIMEEAQTGWDAIETFLSDTVDGYEAPDKEGLAGAIAGITEDTAGIIAGQMMAIRFNVLEQLEIAQSSLNAVNQIALNTSHNKRLIRIEQILSNAFE